MLREKFRILEATIKIRKRLKIREWLKINMLPGAVLGTHRCPRQVPDTGTGAAQCELRCSEEDLQLP